MEHPQSLTRSPATTPNLPLRLIMVVGLLFVFLVGVDTLSASFKMMGSGFASTLLTVSSHPVIGLFSGMLATALIQSSSTTTAIIVGLCSGGALSISGAVPMIMGANIGTSVTNSLVSLSYLGERQSFQRAFSAATVHDIFNVLSVAILLPLELATGLIEKMATLAANAIYGASSGVHLNSPIKAAIKPVSKGIQTLLTDTFGLVGPAGGVALMLAAALIIIGSLATVVRVMKTLVESNKGDIVERLLVRNPCLSVLAGVVVTVSVQSSSITTSLLVPLASAGALSTYSIFPITVGANIGTTATAVIASLTGNVAGLAIAFVHLIFNILGTLIWFPFPAMRRIPVALAERLGETAGKRRTIALVYVGIVFFAVPLGLLTIF